MTASPPLPNLNLAVAIIIYERKFLVTWNPRWGCFTLPMTKIRIWHMENGDLDPRCEGPLDAAIRAAAEGLERLLVPNEIPDKPRFLELQPYSHRSLRDGQWKRFGREVFIFNVEQDGSLPRCVPGMWVLPTETTSLRPLSPDVDEVITALTVSGFVW